VRFWDSSALVPLLLEEPETTRLRQLGAADPHLALWWGSPVECASAIARAERSGVLSSPVARDVERRAASLWDAAHHVEPTEDVRVAALRVLRLHPLRAADALQLAAALAWCRGRTSGAPFVCLDDRLREAASREGFLVEP